MSTLIDNSVPGGVAASVSPADISPEAADLLFADSVKLARKSHAPRLLEILSEDKFLALTDFDIADIKAVEAAIESKNGKEHFKCLKTGKLKLAKPEEAVRQLWLARLQNHYHYPKTRIDIEFPITFGRDTSKRADIVIFDKDRPTVPYIIIEVKAVKLKDGKDQLKSYCHATGAPIGVWSDGGKTSVYNRRNPNYFVPIPDLPASNQDITEIVNEPWTLELLRKKYAARERHKPLKDLIEEMEDEVLSNAGVDVFEEVFKLIFTKLYDELSHHQGHSKSKFLRFRNQNTETDLKTKIGDLFEEAKERWPGVFTSGDGIKLSGSHLQVCIGALEEEVLFNSNLDVVDEAFEYLINKSSKGEKGQYFTPRWVIDMCVKMLNPKETETVIDTACGSAGFTVHSIFHVWREILRDENIEISHLFTAEKKPPRCDEYVREKVFAIDFDEKAVRVARCLNLIAGDGQTNVMHLNTLDFRRWDETTKSDEWRDTYGEGWKKIRKLRPGKPRDDDKDKYRFFGFDVLMANPPFAGDIKQSDMLAPYDLAHKDNGKQENKVGRDLLFIERNLDFLKPGGRMAVVLPQGRFNNSSDKRLREFIADKCRILAVVGIDGNTFKPHTGTKTSVLFVQKWDDELCPKQDDYPIFFATQQLRSKDNSGDKLLARDKNGKLMMDNHGHFVVQHDLFNHENETKDGIYEAFQQFAAKEKLSFF
jgi:type I restriction enzyme M protein